MCPQFLPYHTFLHRLYPYATYSIVFTPIMTTFGKSEGCKNMSDTFSQINQPLVPNK